MMDQRRGWPRPSGTGWERWRSFSSHEGVKVRQGRTDKTNRAAWQHRLAQFDRGGGRIGGVLRLVTEDAANSKLGANVMPPL